MLVQFAQVLTRKGFVVNTPPFKSAIDSCPLMKVVSNAVLRCAVAASFQQLC